MSNMKVTQTQQKLKKKKFASTSVPPEVCLSFRIGELLVLIMLKCSKLHFDV